MSTHAKCALECFADLPPNIVLTRIWLVMPDLCTFILLQRRRDAYFGDPCYKTNSASKSLIYNGL